MIRGSNRKQVERAWYGCMLEGYPLSYTILIACPMPQHAHVYRRVLISRLCDRVMVELQVPVALLQYCKRSRVDVLPTSLLSRNNIPWGARIYFHHPTHSQSTRVEASHSSCSFFTETKYLGSLSPFFFFFFCAASSITIFAPVSSVECAVFGVYF